MDIMMDPHSARRHSDNDPIASVAVAASEREREGLEEARRDWMGWDGMDCIEPVNQSIDGAIHQMIDRLT